MAHLQVFRREVLKYHDTHGRSFPWRETENLYEVMISEVLLQRTRGEHVVAVYREMLRRWPDIDRLARARVSTIERVIEPLGLRKRAPVIKKLARAVVELGGVPSHPEELLPLSGIGPYGAHAIPIFAESRDLPLVDWVIARVLRRYFGLVSERRPNADRELWNLAAELAEMGCARELWFGVLDLGAAFCKSRPLCQQCPLEQSCCLPAASAVGVVAESVD